MGILKIRNIMMYKCDLDIRLVHFLHQELIVDWLFVKYIWFELAAAAAADAAATAAAAVPVETAVSDSVSGDIASKYCVSICI